jgi:hypothetical protein
MCGRRDEGRGHKGREGQRGLCAGKGSLRNSREVGLGRVRAAVGEPAARDTNHPRKQTKKGYRRVCKGPLKNRHHKN